MTGVKDKTGTEIKLGDVIRVGLDQYDVVECYENGHNGIYAERRYFAQGEPQITRILLLAINPAGIKILR